MFLVRFFENNKWHLIIVVASVSLYFTRRFLFSGGVCKSKARLDGKTVIITGSNTGIGKATALDLAKRGARVILACRDVKKAVIAADEIRNKSGNGNVIVESVDLGKKEDLAISF